MAAIPPQSPGSVRTPFPLTHLLGGWMGESLVSLPFRRYGIRGAEQVYYLIIPPTPLLNYRQGPCVAMGRESLSLTPLITTPNPCGDGREWADHRDCECLLSPYPRS